jgi:signal transduction histidine kinase
MRMTTLGELTASIAHEVNQPLAAAVANAEACLRWLDRETPDLAVAGRSVEWVINDSCRASEAIRRVRALAKKSDFAKVPLDVNDVVREAIGLVKRELSSQVVFLRTELAPSLPTILGDRVQLQQVIINLLMNGIEAMQRITYRQRELVIRSGQDEKRRCMSVSPTVASGSPPRLQIGCSTHSSPPRPAGWEWGSRSAVRSWRRTRGVCRLRPMRGRGRRFNSSCPRNWRKHRDRALQTVA